MLDDFPLKQLISLHQDFPRKGDRTRDLSGLLAEPRALQTITDTFAHRYVDAPLTHLVALKGRGTMFAAVLAYRLNLPLLLIRELGEEPSPVLHERAAGNTGERTLEMREGLLDAGCCVLLFDDILCTGASLIAASTLIRRQQAKIHEAATLIDLPDQGGSERLQQMDVATYSLLAFAGH
jgi:adenine phosphoribosyltransferase